MAVREFDGIDDRVLLSAGGASAVPNGAYTLLTLVKPNTLTTGAVIALQVADTGMVGSLIINSVNLRVYTDAVDTFAFVGVSDAEWQLIAVTKAAGNVVPRFHRKLLGSGSWSHADGNAALPDSATAVTRIALGAGVSFGSVALWKAQRLAVAAVFGSALSDANLEAIETAKTTQSIADLTPVALWDLNQASTATAVSDLKGSSSQTSLVGTAVATGDDPSGWTFGVSAGGGGGRDTLSGSSDVATGTRDELSGSSDVLSGPKDVL